MPVLFLAAVLQSAALMFILEPMFARMVLPLLGGSPAVWNTALVFYQIALLLGYGYVHGATRRLTPRHQAFVQLGLLVAAFACLPIALRSVGPPPSSGQPLGWLLLVLGASVGLPFLAVATTGPLLQKWLATTSHRSAQDPYWLYAASNLGSFVGLLAYPLVIEPRWTLAQQSRVWSWGFAVLAALVVACALATRRFSTATSLKTVEISPASGEAAPSLGRRLRWVLAGAGSLVLAGAIAWIATFPISFQV